MSESVDCKLLIPGLSQLLRSMETEYLSAHFPALNRFFSRARKQSSQTAYFSLVSQALTNDSSERYPYAALQARYHGLTDGYWVRAVPIELLPDRDRLLMQKTLTDELTPPVIERVSSLLMDYFRDDIAEVHFHDDAWLIRMHTDSAICFYSWIDALGNNIDRFMPTGNDQKFWHALINEVQMLLYQDEPVSAVLNTLWFEAGGSLEELTDNESRTRMVLMTDNDLLKVVASERGLTVVQKADQLDFGNGLLMVDDKLLRHPGAVDGLAKIEDYQQLFQTLMSAMAKGQFKRIQLYTLDGYCFELSRLDLFKFWKRRLSI